MNRIIFIVVLIYIWGCSPDKTTDPEPVDETFYTIEVAADVTTTDSDDWVLASDASGKWLDAQQYEAGQTVLLKGSAPLPQAVNLTFLSVRDYGAGPRFDFKTYTEMPVNGTWKVKPVVFIPLDYPTAGSANIKVKNYNGDFLGIKVSALQGNLSNSMMLSGSELSINVSLSHSPSDLVLSYRQGNDYKSTVIKNVTTNSIVNLDAVDIHSPETNYRFSFPNNTFYYVGFYGYEPGDDPRYTGYIISEHIDNDGGVPDLLLGYYIGYDKYKSIVSYGAGNYYHTYYKFGTPMEDYPTFGSPSPTHSGSLNNFNWNPGLPFSQSSVFFHNPVAKNVVWEIMSKKNQGLDLSVSIEQFPSNLRDTYPSLNVDEIIIPKSQRNFIS